MHIAWGGRDQHAPLWRSILRVNMSATSASVPLTNGVWTEASLSGIGKHYPADICRLSTATCPAVKGPDTKMCRHSARH